MSQFVGQTKRNITNLFKETYKEKMVMDNVIRQDAFLRMVDGMGNHDMGWDGQDLIVPLKRSRAVSVRVGGYTPNGEIVSQKYARGAINRAAKLTASMVLEYEDMEALTGFNKNTMIDIVTDTIENLIQETKEKFSRSIFAGSVVARVVGTPTTDGVVEVDRIDAFEEGERFLIKKADNTIKEVISGTPNLNTRKVKLTDTDGSDENLSSYVAGSTIHHPGSLVEATGSTKGNVVWFNSLGGILLPASVNSSGVVGESNVYGLNKVDHKILQALSFNSGASGDFGSTATTAENFRTRIFAGLSKVDTLGYGKSAKHLCTSLNNYYVVVNELDKKQIAYKTADGIDGQAAIKFVASGSGACTLEGVRECPDDILYGLDKKEWRMASQGGLKHVKAKGTDDYFTIRGNKTEDYKYIRDYRLSGQVWCRAPQNNWTMRGLGKLEVA